MLVLLLFFCSGATALVYEVIWSKYLTLLLGSTVQAQTLVLAVYMGGLALGNQLFGRKSPKLAEPLMLYGVLEMAIALYAFSFPQLYKGGEALFVALGTPISRVWFLVFSLKLVLSVLLLLLPTILMGGTLPLLAAWIERRKTLRPSTRVGIFYAINSLGAVVGAGLGGFAMVQEFGMVYSLELAALANLIVGIAAAFLGRSERGTMMAKSEPPKTAAPEAASRASATGTFRQIGILVALTGGVSMGLEVLSSRALALIAGGSLQAFAIVLMSFILGIGLGSAAISSIHAAHEKAFATIFLLLMLAGAIVAINVLFIENWAVIYSQARYGLAPNRVGYHWHEIALAAVSFVILGLPAACLGAVLPLSIRLGDHEGLSLGDEVGRLLTWNTCGAVAGVLLTGFVFMPALGLRGALALLALLLIAFAGVIALKRQVHNAFYGSVAMFVITAAAVLSTGGDWQRIVGAGLFRIRNQYLTLKSLKETHHPEILFYKDSADATVSVERTIQPDEPSQISLRINGKVDASSRGDLPTQYLLAHLPMMANPDAKRVFVLGFGSGITAGALLGHPIEQLTIAENCKPVLQAAPLFREWNRGVLTNARTLIRNEDARTVLKLSAEKYDVIISEPSNPWVAGISGVFSQEFYKLSASRLADGGIMAQWFHKYEMNDTIVALVVRTFCSVFPFVELWDPQEGDLILVGSQKPWNSSPEQWQKVFNRPEPRKDFNSLGIGSPEILWARQANSQATAFAIPGDGPIETDELPILEYDAPVAFFIGSNARRLFFFDERTLQFPLATREKVAAMRSIPDKALLAIFNQADTYNPDIRLYLNAVAHRQSGGMERLDPMGEIIFRPPSSYPEHPPIPTNATPEFRICLTEEARMLRQDAAWKDGAAHIEQVLIKILEQRPVRLDFSPTYYAAFVARFAIGHGDYHRALEALRLGFSFTTADEQLLFLSRALDRIFPPSEIHSLTAPGARR